METTVVDLVGCERSDAFIATPEYIAIRVVWSKDGIEIHSLQWKQTRPEFGPMYPLIQTTKGHLHINSLLKCESFEIKDEEYVYKAEYFLGAELVRNDVWTHTKRSSVAASLIAGGIS